MSDSPETNDPPVDVMAILANQQAQLDDLVRAYRAQQTTIDALRAEIARLSGTDDEQS